MCDTVCEGRAVRFEADSGRMSVMWTWQCCIKGHFPGELSGFGARAVRHERYTDTTMQQTYCTLSCVLKAPLILPDIHPSLIMAGSRLKLVARFSDFGWIHMTYRSDTEGFLVGFA